MKSKTQSQGEKPVVRDDELVRRAQEGEVEAFELLYGRHSRRVYRVCLRMVKNEALAEDLTQETFIQVFRKLGTFRREAAFTTWLHRVATNTVFMYLRKWQPVTVAIDELERPESGGPDKFIALEKEDSALRSCIDRLTLHDAMMQMTKGYRMVLWLHDIMGYKHPEIARKLRFSVGNSKSQLHKARRRLRIELDVNRAPQLERAA